jgi:hypothetical protein
MARAMLQSPTHRGKQMKCFAEMSKHDDDQTPGAEQHQIPTGSGVASFHCLPLQATENRRAGEKGNGESLGQWGWASLSQSGAKRGFSGS